MRQNINRHYCKFYQLIDVPRLVRGIQTALFFWIPRIKRGTWKQEDRALTYSKQNVKQHHLNRGFTLLEIIIALFIFSIVSLIMVGALHTVITLQSATEKKAADFAKLQTALLLLSRDFEQTIDRPVTDANGKVVGFIGETHNVTFTHGGLSNPFGQLQRTTLQRTRYELSKNSLIRIIWPVLDVTPKTRPDEKWLLNSVSALQFAYLDSKNHFQTKWPPDDQPKAVLPKAVRLSFTLKNLGQITELYLIPGSSSEKTN
ncbi:MAG: hypothetical protein ACD_60C00128G0017 [uncultured bacterium]|nr:MAG: hypothetical protein ACD_60C00128G0017 [uncultured bacterium]